MKGFFALLLLPLVALAGAPNEGPPPKPPEEPPSWEQVLKVNQEVDVKNTNVNILKADASAESKATADASAKVGDITTISKGGDGGQGGQGGQGGAGGTSTVGDTTATGGNVGDINMTSGGVTIKNPRQAPMAYAPDVFPSSDKCDSGGFSLGLSSPVGGVSFGKGQGKTTKKPSDDCLFSLAQQWASGGQYDLWCKTLLATNSAIYVFGNSENTPTCDNIRGPAPQGLVSTPQPSVVVVPIAVPQGQSLTVEHLEQAFRHAMQNK